MIHVVIGTKAQLIKMAPLLLRFQQKNIPYNFILTGQHRETIDDLRENFSVKPADVVLYRGKDIVSVPSMLIWGIRILFLALFRKKSVFGSSRRASIVLVHGDTFSTLLGALMGKLGGVAVAHVESGLRSGNLLHPFPEELTRLLVFSLADYYFCPGQWSVGNLARYRGKKIDTRYNTLLDSLRHAIAMKNPDAGMEKNSYCVVTIHRFENIFSRKKFEHIVALIELIARQIRVVFILHPVTEKTLRRKNLYGRLENNSAIDMRPRYDYINFIQLISRAEFVVSDGGSNQEECSYLGIPCLLLRKFTERQEGLESNVILSGYSEKRVTEFLANYRNYKSRPIETDLSPSDIIVQTLLASGFVDTH